MIAGVMRALEIYQVLFRERLSKVTFKLRIEG